MEIERRPYEPQLHGKEGAYIHRYYLPQHCRKSIQFQDLAALYETILDAWFKVRNVKKIRRAMLDGPCTIRYQVEGLVKEIPTELLEPAVDACIRYHRDRWDFSLTREEADFLMALNKRLRKLEHDINTACYRLNQEMHARQERGEPFLDDYDIDAKLSFILREDLTLYREDDDNIIHESNDFKTAGPDRLEEWIQEAREHEEMDWNDARGATNPVIRNNPLFNVPHCWLFHDLQSHSRVPLRHLCGIGTIWVNIRVRHQSVIAIGKDFYQTGILGSRRRR